jgi:hypothetical protein
VSDLSPARAFGIKIGLFVAVVAAIVLIWFLIGHALAIIVLAVAVVALVSRMVMIYRHTRGGQQM